MEQRVLKTLRGIKGYSVSEMAAHLDISPSHLSRIENGEKNLTEELLKKYCKLLRINVATVKFFIKTDNQKKMEYQELMYRILLQIYKKKSKKIDTLN